MMNLWSGLLALLKHKQQSSVPIKKRLDRSGIHFTVDICEDDPRYLLAQESLIEISTDRDMHKFSDKGDTKKYAYFLELCAVPNNRRAINAYNNKGKERFKKGYKP